ncbi:MAG: tRNA uridine(34) 5-carboxymethylaminomethyl modification radical SAM/GNAT enzyme Elp3 [bacterium]
MIYKNQTNNERQAILDIINSKPKTLEALALINRQSAKKYGVAVSGNSRIIECYRVETTAKRISEDKEFERLLRRRVIRTQSGIAPIAVLTKPFACPGKCAYCPTEKDVPQSYLSNEPAVMRAIRCSYNPYVQVIDRLKALVNNGHEPTKMELIVIGGTWSVLPIKYKYWYIASCFAAANNFTGKKGKDSAMIKESYSLDRLKKILKSEQKRNEKAKYQIIGLTLETRPDYISENELQEMRELGCTRVELGVQAIDDEVLKLNKRGHKVEAIVEATSLLRNYGFKITYHLMPGLPGSTIEKDFLMFKKLFSSPDFQPDQIKFYPTVVTKGSLLHKWWLAGKYVPYTDEELKKLIINCKAVVPGYVRIIRLIRDIPGESILAGNLITNLRQVLQQQGVKCSCIRCREPKSAPIDGYKFKTTTYDAAFGQEVFIEACSDNEKILYGFCRLRLMQNNVAIVRELHVYGELVTIGGEVKVQHSGLGRQLLEKAEAIAISNSKKRLSIISGVGVRAYYRKFGYRLSGTYMVKSLG